MTLSEKLCRQPNELVLFLSIHGMNRAPELSSSPRFDFDKDQHRAVLRHEVQLDSLRFPSPAP